MEKFLINMGTHSVEMDRTAITKRLQAYGILSESESMQHKTHRLAELLNWQEKETRRLMPETIRKFRESQAQTSL